MWDLRGPKKENFHSAQKRATTRFYYFHVHVTFFISTPHFEGCWLTLVPLQRVAFEMRAVKLWLSKGQDLKPASNRLYRFLSKLWCYGNSQLRYRFGQVIGESIALNYTVIKNQAFIGSGLISTPYLLLLLPYTVKLFSSPQKRCHGMSGRFCGMLHLQNKFSFN